MLPAAIKDALDSILGDLNTEEADKKRKKYAPPEEDGAKPHHGVTITIVTGGKHPEPDGDEAKAKGDPLESPDELAKLLGGDQEEEAEAEPAEEEEPPEETKRPKKKPRRY